MMKKILLCFLLPVLLLLSGCSKAPDSPPPLQLTIGDQTIEITSGSYDWNMTPAFGSGESVIACGMHPLDGEYTPIETLSKEASVSFDPAPLSCEILCWPEGSAFDAEATVLLPHHDSFPLQEGTWIYQLHAKWQDDGYNGQADYAFSVTRN